MNYEHFFVTIKNRIQTDLEGYFPPFLLDGLSLSLNYGKRSHQSSDLYRSRTAKAPAYYNPNSHTVHLNIAILENAQPSLVENIYYHELVHATSHHAHLEYQGNKILKSGLKVQLWDENDRPITLHRGLNEGFTQYLANSYTSGGPAYKPEVQVIGKLIRKIGVRSLTEAYFGPSIDKLEQRMAIVLGSGIFQQLSQLVDAKEYEAALALLD